MIRPFSLEDLNQVLQIERHSFPKSPYDWITFVHLHDLHPDTFWVYVETQEDTTKGQVMGYIVSSPQGHIISIAVHPRHRRMGIGRQLLDKVICAPRVKKVWAEVRRGNRGAQAFYLQMGFQIVGEVPNYYGNEDALIIQWRPAESG